MPDGETSFELAALRRELTDFRDREFGPSVIRNDADHEEIKNNVRRINGDVGALKLWRAEFLGQLKGATSGGRAIWAFVAMAAGPITAVVMKLLEK